MAKLSKDEAKMLKQLTEKQEAPDAPAVGRSLNIAIDLGDDAQVARAQKLGLLGSLDDDDGDDDGDDDDDEEAPKRRGYFKDTKK